MSRISNFARGGALACAIALYLALSGCASVESSNRQYLGVSTRPAKAAGFTLAARQVLWQSNPQVPVRFWADRNANAEQRSKLERELATYFRDLQQLIAVDVSQRLQARLQAASAQGSEHLILLTPIGAERFLGTAAGVGLTVRVQVIGRDGSSLWQDDLTVRQGYGAMFSGYLPKPDADVAETLATGAMTAFKDVGLVKP